MNAPERIAPATLIARPAWMRQPGERLVDWDWRRMAENEAELAHLHAQPTPLNPLYSGMLDMACGVGTFDGNGNPKGSGWW